MPYQIPTAGIEDSAVNAAKIATDAVGTTEIIADGVRTADIQNSAVTTAKINNDAVTYAKIQNVATANRVLGSTSAAGVVSEVQVQTAMIANSAVTTAKINDESVTLAKLDPSINFFPSGGIVMWSGATNAVPTGWVICDGQNGTPDLRNRFVIGATAGSGDTSYPGLSPNATGGSADAIVVAHTHTGSLTPVGDHSHSYDRTGENNASRDPGSAVTNQGAGGSNTGGAGGHNHTVTVDSTGSSGTNANLPPYMALAYIMKT